MQTNIHTCKYFPQSRALQHQVSRDSTFREHHEEKRKREYRTKTSYLPSGVSLAKNFARRVGAYGSGNALKAVCGYNKERTPHASTTLETAFICAINVDWCRRAGTPCSWGQLGERVRVTITNTGLYRQGVGNLPPSCATRHTRQKCFCTRITIDVQRYDDRVLYTDSNTRE